MATTSTYECDLSFTRFNVITNKNEYRDVTVYSVEAYSEELSNMMAQGWTLYLSRVL